MVIRSPWQFGGRSDEQVVGILPKVEHSFRTIDDPKTISLRGTSRMSSRRKSCDEYDEYRIAVETFLSK